jgi:hypothetical protein
MQVLIVVRSAAEIVVFVCGAKTAPVAAQNLEGVMGVSLPYRFLH